MDIKQITVVKRKVRYPRLELRSGLPVLILPQRGNFDPKEVISKHRKWLEKKLDFIEKIKNKYKNQRIYQRSEGELVKIVENLVEKYLKILKAKPSKIRFRWMKSRWGSCSKKGSINLNLMLKHLPFSLIRYVVFHEMVHLQVHNHRKDFWFNMRNEFGDHKQYEERLFGYWFLINSGEKGNSLGVVAIAPPR